MVSGFLSYGILERFGTWKFRKYDKKIVQEPPQALNVKPPNYGNWELEQRYNIFQLLKIPQKRAKNTLFVPRYVPRNKKPDVN